MSRRRKIGPIFFDATITTAAYMEIFNTFVNQLEDEKLSTGYFQQDGATSDTSHVSMAEIQSFFGDRVIWKGLRRRRSPDLTPPDYSLWGCLKGRVYRNKPRTTDALQANVTEEIQAVTADVLARTFQIWRAESNPVWTQMVATSSTCYDVITFLKQCGKSASNFVAISSLVVKLLKKCRVR